MSRFNYALLPLAILGCGQAAPGSEPTSAVATQHEQLQGDQNGMQAPSKKMELAASNGASAGPSPRCVADDVTRRATLIAPMPQSKPNAKYRAPSGPPKPEVYGPPLAHAVGEPVSDQAVAAGPVVVNPPELKAQSAH